MRRFSFVILIGVLTFPLSSAGIGVETSAEILAKVYGKILRAVDSAEFSVLKRRWGKRNSALLEPSDVTSMRLIAVKATESGNLDDAFEALFRSPRVVTDSEVQALQRRIIEDGESIEEVLDGLSRVQNEFAEIRTLDPEREFRSIIDSYSTMALRRAVAAVSDYLRTADADRTILARFSSSMDDVDGIENMDDADKMTYAVEEFFREHFEVLELNVDFYNQIVERFARDLLASI